MPNAPIEDALDEPRIFVSGPSQEFLGICRRLEKIPRIDQLLMAFPFAEDHHAAGCEDRNFILPFPAVDDPGRSRAEQLHRLGVDAEEAGIEDSGQLEGRSRGIEQWSHDIEDGPAAPLGSELACLPDCPKSRVVLLREEKDRVGLAQDPGDGGRREIDPDPERFQNIGSAGLGGDPTIPVLHHTRARTGNHEHRRGADVEKAPTVSAGSADIDDRSRGSLEIDSRVHCMLKESRHESGHFPRRLAASVKRNQNIRLPIGWDLRIQEPLAESSRLVIVKGRTIVNPGNPIGHPGRMPPVRSPGKPKTHESDSASLSR